MGLVLLKWDPEIFDYIPSRKEVNKMKVRKDFSPKSMLQPEFKNPAYKKREKLTSVVYEP